MSATTTINRLLGSCDASQQAAITSSAAPLLVVAGAGSGKTRVLTRRIAWQILTEEVVGDHLLALTFTRKAATELRDRLSHLGLSERIAAGTFHALALAQLRRRAMDEGRPLPVILDSKARLLGAVVPERTHHFRDAKRPIDRREIISLVASEIEWAKARGIHPNNYEVAAKNAERSPIIDPEFVAAAFTGYELEKKKRRVLDFDDILSSLVTAMAESPDFAATQRWRFRHFYVDEFQDASPTQLQLLDMWLGERPSLFAVGDPRQAIYGWNGADHAAIAQFTDRYKNGTVLHLDTNYRSTPQVVTLAAAALRRDERRDSPAPRPDGSVPSVVGYEDDATEARAVAQGIIRAHAPGRRWSDCAVLARTNNQLNVLAAALKDAGIPHRAGDARHFLALPHIRTAMSSLERCDNALRFAGWIDDLAGEVQEAVLQGADTETPPSPSTADLELLLGVAREYADLDAVATGPACAAYVREASRTGPLARRRDAVDLVTFHRAKGLEWPFVWVTGLEDGFVPISFAKSPEAVSEERRLLYVALSRAEDELFCSWSKSRRFGGRTSEREPSPWLTSLENARQVLERQTRTNVNVAATALAESRAALGRSAE